MKKFLFAFAFLFLLLLPARSQVRLAGFAQMNSFSAVQTYSVGMQCQYSPWETGLFLNYEIGGGITGDGKGYFHCDAGLPLVFLLLADSSRSWLKLLGIAGALVPKGMSYAIGAEQPIEFHLNINPLSIDLIGKNNDTGRKQIFTLSGDYGIGAQKNFESGLFVKPYIGAKWLYGNGWVGIQAGVAVGGIM